MPAWVEERMKRMLPEMQKQYGKRKGKQVAWATATQQHKKTAGDTMTEEILKQAMWDAYVDEFWKLAQMPASGVKPPIGGATTIKPPKTPGLGGGAVPAKPMPISGYKPGSPPAAGALPSTLKKPAWGS